MLEKIKAFAETVRAVLLYLVTPFVIIGGFIYYLIEQGASKQAKLDQSEAERALAKTLADKQEAHYEAKQKSDNYESVRDRYLAEHPDESGSEN